MIRTICLVVLIILMVSSAGAADELSRERQIEIVRNYLIATGQTEALQAFSTIAGETAVPDSPIKCGTPAVLDFVFNRDKIDAALLKTLADIYDRPTGLSQNVTSASGRFLIHYTTTGADAVYNGFPGYADSVAKIFDEVYAFLVDTLGYPDPPTDVTCDDDGGSAAFDVYLYNLNPVAFGYTFPVCQTSNQTMAAFMALDNDYQEISEYADDPLMAVRVTCAHEFFHVVQFGVDITEGSFSPDNEYRSYWMEASATWMEEMKYDHINDYYNYLPFFFWQPEVSIQSFVSGFDLHPYASMVFPLFLSEKYDRDLIHDIWIRCAQLGNFGDDFPAAAQYVIDTLTNGAESFASTFHEFTLWNYFTGSRAVMAPTGYGYEESANYPEFEDSGIDSVIAVYRNYMDSTLVEGPDNPFSPQHNAAFYMRLDELQTLVPDTTYWLCSDGTFPTCMDSMLVLDPTDPWDVMHIDSTFSVGFTLDSDFPYDWGLNIVYHHDGSTDTDIEELTLPDNFNDLIDFYVTDLAPYSSMAFIVSPASSNEGLFSYTDPVYDVGYVIGSDNAVLDSSLISLPGAVFAPYPNPAVVSELDGAGVTFRFQVPTDAESFPIYLEDAVSLAVDIFTVAGEHVRTLEAVTDSDERAGQYETEWNLRNADGEPTASGVYLAYARLFGGSDGSEVLAEGRTKVLVIR